MTRVALFFVVFLLHWVIQFIAWSYAARSVFFHYVWDVVAAPVFYLSRSLANEYFWALATGNSLLWAACITYFSGRILALR